MSVKHGKRAWLTKEVVRKELYNMNRFKTETMYDYYIPMKFMLLVVKLSSHTSIGYHHSPTMNYT